MKNILKWICIGGVLTVGFVIICLLVLPFFVNIDTYRPVIEQKVTDVTGRSCSIGDKLSLSFFPWAGVTVHNASLGNPDGFTEKEFLKVGVFEVRMKLIPLLFRDVQVKRVLLKKPEIFLIKGEKSNWEFDLADKSAAGEAQGEDQASKGSTLPGLKNIEIKEVSIIDGFLLYKDLKLKSETKISELNLGLSDISFDKPVRIHFSTRINDQPIALDGSLGPVGINLQNKKIPLSLELNALGELQANIKGNVINKSQVDISLNVPAFSMRKLLASLDIDFPVETSDPDTFKKLSLDLRIKTGMGSATITDGKCVLDETTTGFKLDLNYSGHPDIKADIDVDRINADRYLPPASEEETSETNEPGKKENQKTDYSALRSFDSVVIVKIGDITISKVKFSDFLMNLTSVKGLFKLKKMSLNTYDGSVTSSGRFDFRKDTPVMSLNLAGNGIQAGPLLKDALDNDLIEGAMKTGIELSFRGDTPDQIKRSLNGKGSFIFNNGAINGYDLSGMVRNMKSALGLEKKDGKRPRTDFSELTIPFQIQKGLTTISKAFMASPFIRLNTDGTANLVDEKLNMKVHPKFVATIKGQGDEKKRSGILVPIIIKGTFSEPEFAPDLASLLKTDSLGNILKSGDVEKLKESVDLEKIEESIDIEEIEESIDTKKIEESEEAKEIIEGADKLIDDLF